MWVATSLRILLPVRRAKRNHRWLVSYAAAVTTPSIGSTFDRTYPAAFVIEAARLAEAGGLDRMWIIEDCFFTSGPSLAGAALASTERLGIGLGILPAVARTAAVTAMEIATLCALGSGRVIAGIGHGVQEWMGQMGVRPASPLGALDEVLTVVRALLRGEEVTTAGAYVQHDRVRLEAPPMPVPPVLAGVRGARSMAIAGRAADGVVLAGLAGPTYARWCRERAGAPTGWTTAVFSSLCVLDDRREARRLIAPFVGEQVVEADAAIRAVPFFDDLVARHDRLGVEGIVTMPDAWWAELGPIGTMDDAVAHVAALGEAGVDHVGLCPGPELSLAREHLADAATLARALA